MSTSFEEIAWLQLGHLSEPLKNVCIERHGHQRNHNLVHVLFPTYTDSPEMVLAVKNKTYEKVQIAISSLLCISILHNTVHNCDKGGKSKDICTVQSANLSEAF